MKGAVLIVALLASSVAASTGAASFQWSAVLGPGYLNAGVENQEAVRFEVSCPFGQGDKTPLVFVDGPKFRLPPGAEQTAHIVVDGNDHVVGFGGGSSRSTGHAARLELEGLLKAMIVSDAKSFTLTFPNLNHVLIFPLRGARQAIDGSHGWLLDRCPPG